MNKSCVPRNPQPTTPERNYERIDVIVSDLDGGNARKITEALYPKEHIAFLFPRWSPDGRALAFAAVKYVKEEAGNPAPTRPSFRVTREMYVAFQPDFSGQRLYVDTNVSASPDVQWYGANWSKDSRTLLVSTGGGNTYLRNLIVVSLDSSATPEPYPIDPSIPIYEYVKRQGHYDAQTFHKRTALSPDRKYEANQTEAKTIGYWPPGGGIDYSSPVHWGTTALYLRRRTFGGKKIKLADAYWSSYLWTPDSQYLIMPKHGEWRGASQSSMMQPGGEVHFTFSDDPEKRPDGFYIVDLQGNSLFREGCNPDVQFSPK